MSLAKFSHLMIKVIIAIRTIVSQKVEMRFYQSAVGWFVQFTKAKEIKNFVSDLPYINILQNMSQFSFSDICPFFFSNYVSYFRVYFVSNTCKYFVYNSDINLKI